MRWNPKGRIKLTVDEIRDLIVGEEPKFPKYAAPILNLANRFAQATRPKVVGQMSELVKECPYKNFEGWRRWYIERYPNAIDDATDKLMKMLENFKDVLDKLDRGEIKKWVEDLVLVKTFLGLRVQEPVLKYFATILKEDYRLSTPEEESKGIDGYIGDVSLSIKPFTYKEKEKVAGEYPGGDAIIFYEKDRENNIIITEIEGLSEKGDEFIERVRKSFEGLSLFDFD